MLGLQDIANLKENNRAEIFNFINQKSQNGQKFFHCGTDLFYILNLNIQQSPDTAERADFATLADWILDEKTLMPTRASPQHFIALAIKQFLLTNEKQTIFITGERKSGKSENFDALLEFICLFNTGSISSSSIQSVNSHRMTLGQKQKRLESIIAANTLRNSRVESVIERVSTVNNQPD